MLTSTTTCIFYGNHTAVLQRMLDYDWLCGRTPSVVAVMVNEQHPRPMKVFRGDTEMMIPQINSREQAKSFGATVLINFASFRTAPSVIKQALETKLFAYIFTIAEGIPERATRELIALQKYYPATTLIGPSVVGGMVAGVLRIGNTGGSRENIMISRLRQSGSVGLVSKSGGMMNELCRVVSHHTDGVHTALQVGGDRYPMTRFIDIVRLYESTPAIKMIVLLGEVGNQDENEIAHLIKTGVIKKPVVAWVTGMTAEQLKTEVQFGHAGAKANAKTETATWKNNQLREAGAFVPESFDGFGRLIGEVFASCGFERKGKDLSTSVEVTSHAVEKTSPAIEKTSHAGFERKSKDLSTSVEVTSPAVEKTNPAIERTSPAVEKTSHAVEVATSEQIDKKVHLIKNRRATRFTSTISDERGEELLYNQIPVDYFVEQGSLGKVIGHLWLKNDLPAYACRFIEIVLILLADHGPAVSGATNTIITSRAGKDLISSLIAGFATIGPRFGGAIDGSASRLFDAVNHQKTAQMIVDEHKQQGQYIQGIGHRIKSIHHPDRRCELLRELSAQFPVRLHLDLALQVQSITTMKKPNLILNVDGHVAAMLLDIFVDTGFSQTEIKQYIDAGLFNGLFVLARTIGFIGHYLDQKRLDEGLYRTPWEDIRYRA